MRCDLCEASPATQPDVVLIRTNEVGVRGVFRCTECLGTDNGDVPLIQAILHPDVIL